MRKCSHFSITLLLALTLTQLVYSQEIRITGTVRNSSSNEVISSVSVVVKGGTTGTYTSEQGTFELRVSKLPVTLEFSSIGFATLDITVTNASEPVNVKLEQVSTLGQDVVVSASRLPERILESPVSIERVSSATIRTAPAANYYDVLSNLKGVELIASSLTFKTPTTRGFAGSGNTRFNQIVDGMDNQAPGLNFSVGSVIGLTELDVDNMELLPGASSALYGPGGMNGTLLITSKDPFKYQGLSLQIKQGIMHVDGRERNLSPYYNWSLRWAQKVSDKFAFKINSELIQAKDWLADDYRDYKRLGTSGTIVPGTRSTDPNYDGVNVYGDETSIDLRTQVLNKIAQQVPFWQSYINSLPANIPVSRTGYTEKEVVNPNTLNFKLSGALQYKITDKLEAILEGYWGTGNTVYTGSQRYSLKNMKMGQYKLELRAKNWFLRGYTTQENAGESHNLTITTQLFNEAWKPSATWYQQYAFAYINAKMGGFADIDAHNIARATADQGRPKAGSAQFQQIFDQVRMKPIPQGGLFLDKSDLYMVEGQYNLSSAIKFAELLIGGNWKQYVLNSEGTLFADLPGHPIKINEMGAYAQLSREIVKNVLKLSASGRYDKNENFQGRFTPRITALISPAKDHNFRLSYQTAYRFPSTQQQWIDLNVGTGRLLGANIALWEKYGLLSNPGYDPLTVPPQGTNPTKITYKEVKPESVSSFEVGYKSLIKNKVLIDIYGYWGAYENFLSRRDVIQFPGGVPGPNYTGYSIVVNSPAKVKTYGWGASIEWLLPKNFNVKANINSDNIKDVPTGFHAYFDVPAYKTGLSLSNTGFGHQKLLGFDLTWRWQDGFFYENDFAQGDLQAYNVVDAALTYKRPKIRSIIKLGATNLLNQYYRTAIGNPSIGGLYYISFAYNVL
ncbi:MAG: carboxypeptidase-like regulatory domain-containing protein [Chitinophagaceae bacterium]|nr:carboxypeptidase-like regulatory domain-containing protein [Chitinophagaceae bacterium]